MLLQRMIVAHGLKTMIQGIVYASFGSSGSMCFCVRDCFRLDGALRFLDKCLGVTLELYCIQHPRDSLVKVAKRCQWLFAGLVG